MIDIIETVYRGASKGRGLVVSPRGEWKWNASARRRGTLTHTDAHCAIFRLLDAAQVLEKNRTIPESLFSVSLHRILVVTLAQRYAFSMQYRSAGYASLRKRTGEGLRRRRETRSRI